MLPPDARIVRIAERLAALGLVPEREEYADRTVVRARVPDSLPAAAWPDVLAALETADTFGFADGTARGRSLWAAVTTGSPEASDGGEGPPNSPRR